MTTEQAASPFIRLFGRFLRDRGLPVTQQREMVAEVVFASDEHLSVDDIEDALRERGERIGKATIYRTLDLLVESGLIQRVAVGLDGRARYEHMMGRQHHDHLVCVQCGRVIEFRNDHIERLQEEVCSRYGFRMDSHSHRIFGRCKQCQLRAGSSAEARRVARRVL